MIHLQLFNQDHLQEFCDSVIINRGHLSELGWIEYGNQIVVKSVFTDIIDSPEYIFYVIRDDDKFVGMIETKDSEDSVKLGYWIDKDHRNKGIATQAVKMLTGLVSKPVIADTTLTNPASIRVLEKAGFVKYREDKVAIWYRFAT